MSYTIGFKEEWIKRALNRGNKSFILVHGRTKEVLPTVSLRDPIKKTEGVEKEVS